MSRKFVPAEDDGEPVPEGHAFAETRDLHPRDIQIRAVGFRIHSRPRNGEAVWKDIHGDLWAQSEVVRYLNRTYSKKA